MKYYYKLLIVLMLGVSFQSCQDDDTEFGPVTAPSNLELNVAIQGQNATDLDGDGTGIVVFNATATNALNYTYDFGDGRIMQTRPKDESNIRNAIEIMTANSIPSIGWSMVDDIKQAVTATDLQEALTAGQLAALDIWNNYNP